MVSPEFPVSPEFLVVIGPGHSVSYVVIGIAETVNGLIESINMLNVGESA